RRFEHRQGHRRLGTEQEQPLWQRKPLEQTAHSPSPASVHQLNVAVVTGPARAKAWVMKVAANSPFGAGESIPDLVKILLQLPLKILDRLSIGPCCPFIRFHSLIRFPDLLLRNTKRLCLLPRAPPINWLAHGIRLLDTAPLLHPFIGDFIATTLCSVPESPHPFFRP